MTQVEPLQKSQTPPARRTARQMFSGSLSRAQIVPSLSGLLVLLCGLLAVAGHVYFPEAFRRDLPTLAAMPQYAAYGFVLLGFAMRLSRWERVSWWANRGSRFSRLLLFVLALSALVEGFGAAGSTVFPISTAVCFVLLGAGLSLLNKATRAHACQMLLGGAGLTALTGLLAGYISAETGKPLPQLLQTDAISAFLVLAAISGMLYRCEDRGLMAVVTSDTVGGSRARLLLPCSIVIPIVLGWFRMQCERAGLLSSDGGLVLQVIVTILLMALVVWWHAAWLVRSTQRNQMIEEAVEEMEVAYRNLFRQSNEAIFIADVHGNLRYVNPVAERLFGRSSDELRCSNIRNLLRPADPAPDTQSILLGGPSQTRRMFLAGSALQVDLLTTVRFREGTPAELLSIVHPVLEYAGADTEFRAAEPYFARIA